MKHAPIKVLDLFSAAAGGWSLGMHRAGFETMAACENIDWRRILYAQNNPGVKIYDDVRTLTAERLLRDFGELPAIIVGSPPCQDISSANTKGKGVEGERSGLFFEAVRLIGECRPRWFALENSANLRTRGADAVLDALEAIDYACWPLVVRAEDIGANHERPRSWLVGCDLGQVADPNGERWDEGWRRGRIGIDLSVPADTRRTEDAHAGQAEWRPLVVQGGNRDWQEGERAEGADRHPEHASTRDDNAPYAHEDAVREPKLSGRPEQEAAFARHVAAHPDRQGEHASSVDAEMAKLRGMAADCEPGKTPDPDQAGQADGRMESGLRQEEITDDGCGDGWGADRPGLGQMAVCANDRECADGSWPLWSLDDLAARIRVDDGLPGRLAGTRVAVGGPRGTAAASLIVEAYGDAVVPQIPEAIGRAFLRIEAAMAAIFSESSPA